MLFWQQRKAYQMDHGHLRLMAAKFPWVLSEAQLNACGTDGTFCRRQRVLTPLRLGLALTATGASQRGEPLADLHGGFQALLGTTVTYKACSHQVAQPHCADLARLMAARLLSERTLRVRGCDKGRACGACRHLLLQDGSSLARHDGLRAGFPGRFQAGKPAAVARQTTLAVRCEAPTTVVVAPATTKEPAFFPAPASRRGR